MARTRQVAGNGVAVVRATWEDPDLRTQILVLCITFLALLPPGSAFGLIALQSWDNHSVVFALPPHTDVNDDGRADVCLDSGSPDNHTYEVTVFVDLQPFWTYGPTTPADFCSDCVMNQAWGWSLVGFGDVHSAPGREAVVAWWCPDAPNATNRSGVAIVSLADGHVLDTYSILYSAAQPPQCWIADVDGTPLEEMLVRWNSPSTISVVGYTTSDIGDGLQVASRQVALATPNPARTPPAISFDLPSTGHVTAELVSTGGRRVRALLDTALPAGKHSLPWDGLDDSGQPAPAGVYFVRVETAEGVQSAKVVLAR